MEEEVITDIFMFTGEEVQSALERLEKGHKKSFGPCQTNSIGCKLCQKSRNKGGTGWVKCKVVKSKSKKEFYIHHLALIAAGRVGELKGSPYQVSHLCHQPTCFNPEHLVVETREENLARNRCIGWTWLTCPCPCGVKFNPCTHIPKCILPQ